MLQQSDFERVDQALADVAQQQHSDLLHLQALRQKYTKLQGFVKELPEKTSYPITVPFGKRAFMPGRMVHTNEVMVLIGANYFVERSASQASGIAARRIEFFDKEIVDLRKRMKSTKMKLEVSQTMAGSHDNGAVEIREAIGANGRATGEVIQQPINPRRAGIEMQAPRPAPDSSASLDEYHGLDLSELVRRLEKEEQDMVSEEKDSGDHTNKEASRGPDKTRDVKQASGPRSPSDIYKMHEKKLANDGGAPKESTETLQVPITPPGTTGAFNGMISERRGGADTQGAPTQAPTLERKASRFKQGRIAARSGGA